MISVNELSLIGLAASSFVATNTDNLLLLVLLQGAYPAQRKRIVLAYLAAVILVILVSLLGLAIGRVLDAGLVGYFGLVPIALGLRMLYLARKDAANGVTNSLPTTTAGPVLATLTLMLANSSDSLLVLIPLLADTSIAGELVLIVSYLACGILWAGLALKIGTQRALAEVVDRWGVKIVPWIVIGVGVYILLDTANDTLVR
ncbi:hypothetical protein BST95_06995 [Halioglobus japonicus]|uniref:cadmium resistance transporter n=1 Tax=Halioglobus japonicus TaxID=930805 RepID=UPI0009791E84|nr:cadmium resistance transporter [Halioglobus japonicus]AQA18024.1 hypothetical protein BST95_06995 [Halioglobus japonicus]GHD14936.1 hypothetical protein GCM10007052_19210 [Halioglobus japonicus]